MNEQIEKLAEHCYETGPIGKDGWPEYSKFNYKKFAELLVFDVLNELTNDDNLGPARIDTIRQLAQRYGVAR